MCKKLVDFEQIQTSNIYIYYVSKLLTTAVPQIELSLWSINTIFWPPPSLLQPAHPHGTQ